MRRLALSLSLLLAACAGHVTMRPFDVETWRNTTPPKPVDGVIVFAPQYMVVTYSFTSLVDPKGVSLGTAADGKCKEAIQKQDLQVLPDYDDAYLVSMTGNFLNANKLGVTLTNGVLTSVNVESAPQAPALITSLATLLEQAAPVAAGVEERVPSPSTACNAEPKVTAFEKYKSHGRS